MCISDIRFGSHIRHVRKTASLGAAGTLTLPANPQRIGIYFSFDIYAPSTTNVARISCEGDFIGMLSAGSNPAQFDIRQHGDLVQHAFVVTNGATAANVTIIEFVASEAEIASAVNEFKRSYI